MKKIILFGLVFLAMTLVDSPVFATGGETIAYRCTGSKSGFAVGGFSQAVVLIDNGDSFFDIYFIDDTQFKDWIATVSGGDSEVEIFHKFLVAGEPVVGLEFDEEPIEDYGRYRAQLIDALIDAIAKDAKLTKVDSKKALDAFISPTTKSGINASGINAGEEMEIVGLGLEKSAVKEIMECVVGHAEYKSAVPGDKSEPGDNIGMCIRGITKEELRSIGGEHLMEEIELAVETIARVKSAGKVLVELHPAESKKSIDG